MSTLHPVPNSFPLSVPGWRGFIKHTQEHEFTLRELVYQFNYDKPFPLFGYFNQKVFMTEQKTRWSWIMIWNQARQQLRELLSKLLCQIFSFLPTSPKSRAYKYYKPGTYKTLAHHKPNTLANKTFLTDIAKSTDENLSDYFRNITFYFSIFLLTKFGKAN